jgi:hypothetical protein
MSVPADQIQRIAGFEINALRAAEVIGDVFEKVRIPRIGTPIHDINGAILFYRMPLRGAKGVSGYTDIAGEESLSEPLLAISMGVEWNEKMLLEKGIAMASKARRGLKYDFVRFVAYSFPKIALQFLLEGSEVLMLELHTWTEVPPSRLRERKPLEPSNFERWSLIDELPKEIRTARIRNFRKRLELWNVAALRRIDPSIIGKNILRIKDFDLKLVDTREVHYSIRINDHHPCYELRGQQTGVWCVAASVEMLLNFYRYQYDQTRLAQEMGLGTCASPNGLQYGDEYKVVDTVEKLSSNTLDATAISDPAWSTFRTEIQANRPLISFIPGHSRTVAGYTRNLIFLVNRIPIRGLLVYDPWPPTDCDHPKAGGVITKWENFATQIYRYAFTAVLKHV